jgi:predicted TIM-barrel fold metal-dependent hydrolase
MTGETQAPFCPGPDPNPRAPSISVPERACDCHVHVFGPASLYSYQQERGYTPPDAPFETLADLHRVLGLGRAVIVQASVHGTDNRAVVDTVARDPKRLRGVCAVGEEVSEAELGRLNEAGVRGVRVNLVDRGGMPFSSLDAVGEMGRRIADMGWHIEFLVHVHESEELVPLVRSLPVPVVVGHVGYVRTDAGIDHPGFREFVALLRDGLGWVKLTGPYRISVREAPPYDDVTPFARAVIEAAPDRVVWGSDWPHVIHHRRMPNDADLIDCLADWAPDEAIRRRILVDNPAKLYGFAS